MSITRAVIVCALLILALGCGRTPEINKAGSPPSSVPPTTVVSSSSDVVKIAVTQLTLIRSGPPVAAVVTLTIAPGFHVNANPATFPYLIATELKPESRPGIVAGKPIYPSAVEKKFQFAEQPLAVYEGEVRIKLPLSAGADASRGSGHLPVDLVVQACDEEKCYAPVAMNATVAIDVK